MYQDKNPLQKLLGIYSGAASGRQAPYTTTQDNLFKALTGTNNDDQPSAFNVGLVQSKWAEITAMKNAGPSGLKTALYEADKLLDYCMVGKGFKGETMGERLKSGGHQFSNINAVWNAHKLRNELAHNVEHDLVPAQVEQAITSLGNAIRELGVTI